MDTLLQYYAQFETMLKSNPVVAGVFSLWGLTIATYLFKNVPASVLRFIGSQITTTMSLNNSGWSGNEELFKGFLAWYGKTDWVRWSRQLAVESISWKGDRTIVGPGMGVHFFVYKRRLFWFNKKGLASQGTDKEKQQIEIYTFGRNQSKFLELVEEFRVKPEVDRISIFTYKEDWNRLTTIRKRDLNTVIMNRELKDSIMSRIEHFVHNRKWYDDRGIPYKLTMVFHGVPGTGKTSIIAALASHYNRNVCIMNVGGMTDSTFERAMGSLPENSIVLIEDFDSSAAFKSRWVSSSKKRLSEATDTDAPVRSLSVSERAPAESPSEAYEPLTLARVLNVLDGIVRLDNTIVIMTTNQIEAIDPAVLRKGRVDWIYEIPLLADTEVREYVRLMYPEATLSESAAYANIAGCDIQGLFLEHKEELSGFLEALPKAATSTPEDTARRTQPALETTRC